MRSFRSFIRGALILLFGAAILLLLDFALYPCTFTRNDIHKVTTQTFDDVYVGTSHGKMNIDPESMQEISGRTGHNLCVGGEYPADIYYLTKLMIETGHAPKRLVYEAGPDYLVREKEEGNNYLLFYHEFPLTRAKLSYFADIMLPCDFRTLLFPWYEYPVTTTFPRIGKTVRTKSGRDFSADDMKSQTQEYHESGFIERYPVDLSGQSPDGVRQPAAADIVPDNMEYLKKVIALCRDNGIEFTAVVTPLPLPTLQQFAQGYQEMWTVLEGFFAEQGAAFLNFNDMQHFDLFTHDPMAFTDYDGHMNGDAARAFSKVLAQQLEGI